jgi:hypothetical protein
VLIEVPSWPHRHVLTCVGLLCTLTAGVARGQRDVAAEQEALQRKAQDKLTLIGREVRLLREADPAKEPYAARYADLLARESQRLSDDLAGKDAPPADANTPELHVVGFYEGSFPNGPKKYGTAVVQVEVTDRPVVLALCAYSPMRWDLRLAEGVRVQRLIMGGYGDQILNADPPAGVAVEKHTHKNGSPHSFYAYPNADSDGTPRAAEVLRGLTGLEIATLQGGYRYPDKPVVVGPKNLGWRQQRVMSRLEPLYREATAPERVEKRQDVAKLRFPAIRWTVAGPMRAAGELAEFTGAGWIEGTLKPLPAGINRITVDPRGPTYYGIQGHSNVARVDLDAKRITVMEIEEDIPELSWPDGVAFDTKRNRLLLTSHGGGGYMYFFDPATNKWSLGRDMNSSRGMQTLTYSPDDDCFFGLRIDMGGRHAVTITRFGPEGNTLSDVDLDRPLGAHPIDLHMTPPQLVAVGGHLAILMAPPTRGVPAAPGAPMTIQLVDPKTGHVTYTGELGPVAETKSDLGPRELADLWKKLREAAAPAAGELAEKLWSHGDAAVAAVRADLPPAPAPPDADALRELLADLDRAQWKDREQATARLISAGEAVEPALRAALAAATSNEVRLRIEVVLKQIRSLREGTHSLEDLDRATGDAALRARLRAIRVLAKAATPAAVRALREIAGGPPGTIDVVYARVALRQM